MTVLQVSKGPRRKLPPCSLSEDGLFHIAGEVEQVECQFVPDTGAAYALMDRRIFERIPYIRRPELHPVDTAIHSAEGQAMKVYGVFDGALNIGYSGTKQIKNIVVADLYKEIALFGWRQMRDLQVVLDFENDLIKIQGQYSPLIYDGEDIPILVKCAESVVVPPNQKKIVIACCSRHPILTTPASESVKLICPIPQFAVGCGDFFAAQCITAQFDRKVPIAFLNTSGKARKLKKGTVLAVATTANIATRMQDLEPSVKTDVTVPEHLQFLVDGISTECTGGHKKQIEQTVINYQDLFVNYNRFQIHYIPIKNQYQNHPKRYNLDIRIDYLLL